MSIPDPFREREAEKYENPIPSREAILALIEKQRTPVSRDELMTLLNLSGEEPEEALRRRLRAMERDGQLIFTRAKAYALPEKMNLVKGTVLGHKDGFGFLRPEEGGEDLFLAPREMDLPSLQSPCLSRSDPSPVDKARLCGCQAAHQVGTIARHNIFGR